MYLKLRGGCQLKKENWEGRIVNTIYADEFDYIVCMHENISEGNIFLIKPESHQCERMLRMWNNMVLDKIRITYLPINSNISTTGHKLQGATLKSLIVNSWAYNCTHWVYVVLSRVKKLTDLVLNEKLDIHRNYNAKQELVRWGKYMKQTIETERFQDRGVSDYMQNLVEEKNYTIF